jgi:hypothetical protein
MLLLKQLQSKNAQRYSSKSYNLTSLSNMTLKWHFEDLADNVKNQLVKKLYKYEYCSLQIDESMDIFFKNADLPHTANT